MACWRAGEEEDGCSPSVQSASAFPSSYSVSELPGPQPPAPGALPRYRKAVFVEFPDASFAQPKPKPAWMGKNHVGSCEPGGQTHPGLVLVKASRSSTRSGKYVKPGQSC